MANTAFDHASALTLPGSTTNNGLVRWGDTSAGSFGNITGITSDGSNLTLLTRGEIRFSDADSSHFIAFESPATVSTSYTMALPAAVPSANDYLKVTSYSGGAGVLEWASVSADTNTTYSTSWVDSSNDAILRLTPSTGSADDLTIVAGSNITLTPSGDNLTIAAAGGGTTINNATANELVTVASTTSELDAEANLTFDGNVLTQSRAGSSEHFINSYTTGTYNPSRIWLNKSQHGTVGSHGALESGDQMGVIYFGGSSGSVLREGAQIMATAEQTWVEDSARGTRLDFSTVPNGSNSMALAMRISNAGEITLPKQPAFSACVGSNKDNVTGGGAWYVIAYDTDSGGNGAWFDTGGNYNTSTYTFTAPVAGVYFFAATVRLLQTDTYNANNVLTEFRTTTNGSSSMMNYRFYHGDYIADVNGVMGIHWSALINLPASGTCQAVVYVAGSSNNIDVDGDTGTGMSYFSGYLLH